ncbi:putative transposable element [Trichonephila clavipes]|nr:putative transposable element [Trichonephila clavipes]
MEWKINCLQWRNGEHMGPLQTQDLYPQVEFSKGKYLAPELGFGTLQSCPSFSLQGLWRCTLRRAVDSLVVRASESRPEGLGSMPDATKYLPSIHGFHAKIVEVGISPRKFSLSPVWCSRPTTGVLLAPCHNEFRGPRSDYVRQGLVESFFKNDEGHNVTVNGDRYRAMITNFVIPELNNHDVQELWFQQDGATCHTARATIDLLKDTLGDRLISRFGPVNWLPRSCDLTPLDYFLWGYVQSLVYVDKPQTLDHLEDNIRRVIADIRPQMLEKVIENWTSRLDYIRTSRGSHMPEIIFKM